MLKCERQERKKNNKGKERCIARGKNAQNSEKR